MGGDGAASVPAGSWSQLRIKSTSANSSLAYTTVRYAGGLNVFGAGPKGAIGIDTATATLSHVTVDHSNYHGLALLNSSSTVSDSIFTQNTNTDTLSNGIYISGGSPILSGNTISNNLYGVIVDNSSATFSSNTFSNNTLEALKISGTLGSYSGNSGSGNGTNAIMIGNGTTVTGTGTTTLAVNSLPYLVKGTATIPNGGVLAFDTGVVVKGFGSAQSQYGLISVSNGGKLYSAGSTPSDLVFTSISDSTVGGTTASGLSAPVPAEWKGIAVSAGGYIDLSGFTLRYGGASAAAFGHGETDGAVKITGSAAPSGKLANALFDYNYQTGLNLSSVSGLLVSDTTFQNHTQANEGTSNAIYAAGSTATFSNLTFIGNQKDGKGSGTNTLTCTNCGNPNTTPTGLFTQ